MRLSESGSDGPPQSAHKIPTAKDFPAKGPNSLASVGQRAVARILDLMVLMVPAMLLVLPFVRIEGEEVKADIPALVGPLALVFLVAYETVMIAWRGQTIGKWVLGVRVARLVDGNAPNLSQALMRIMLPACFLPIPIPVVDTGWLVVYLSSMYNPMRRGWHDKAAGTLVIRTR